MMAEVAEAVEERRRLLANDSPPSENKTARVALSRVRLRDAITFLVLMFAIFLLLLVRPEAHATAQD